MTEKNLLLLRALTVLNDIEGLKAFIQNLMSTDGPQKPNAQGFTVLAQYLMQKVRSLSSFLFIPGVFLNTLLLYLLRKLTKTSSTTAFNSLRPVQSRLPRTRRWWFCSLTGCSPKATTISSSFCSTALGTPSCKFRHSSLTHWLILLLLYLLLVWRWRLSLKCASTGPIWPKIRFESLRVSMRTIVWRSCRPLGSM